MENHETKMQFAIHGKNKTGKMLAQLDLLCSMQSQDMTALELEFRNRALTTARLGE